MPYFIQLMLLKKTILYTIEMYDQFHDVPQQVSIEPLLRIELGTGVLQADFFSQKNIGLSLGHPRIENTRNQLGGTSSRWPPFYTLGSLCHTQFKCQMLNVIV